MKEFAFHINSFGDLGISEIESLKLRRRPSSKIRHFRVHFDDRLTQIANAVTERQKKEDADVLLGGKCYVIGGEQPVERQKWYQYEHEEVQEDHL